MNKPIKLESLRRLREERGLTQAELANRAGVSRQGLGAIEAGRVDPALSLVAALARALGTTIDGLVGGQREGLVAHGDVAVGERVVLTAVGAQWRAHGLSAIDGEQPADGVVTTVGQGRGASRRVSVTLWAEPEPEHCLLAGCAPILGLAAQRLNAGTVRGRYSWLHRTSQRALAGLDRGELKVAGVHSARPSRGRFARVPVFSWTSGLILPAGNPLGLRDVGELGRPGLRLAVREVGAETRALLERLLAREGCGGVLERACVGESHIEVARLVRLGLADVGFGPRMAALALGLDFVALAHEPFDFVLEPGAVDDPRVAALLELTRSRAFRSEAQALGYELPSQAER